jgi:protein involved in polysaccharide export with SLBB domain
MTSMLCWSIGKARADEYRLAADTRIQVAIVQWNPTQGQYERWDALGGTFQVSAEGTIGLPVIGSLQVGDKTSAEAASQISAELRKKVGLLTAPEVTVEIAEYPPIYVVGAVTTPGAYPFRPGLTVLQALAIAGGRFRPAASGAGQDEVSLRGELTVVRTDELRAMGRIARLEAEIAGDAEIRFPPELSADGGSQIATEIVTLERTLFASRANETKRQLNALAELRQMYGDEIQMLDGRSKDSTKEIALAEEEMETISQLVKKGVTTVSRWSELRRVIAEMRATHVEGDIATMRARQNLSDATRQEFGISDQRQTDVATQLRDARGELLRLKSRERTLRELLLGGGTGISEQAQRGGFELRFTVVRHNQPNAADVSASESTPLMPGDVLKVDVSVDQVSQ